MFDATIQDAAYLYNVPESWIRAIITIESDWDPLAYNPNDPGGAWGLMQIIKDTANRYGITDLQSLFDPAVNIDVGTHLLHDLRVRWGDNFSAVASAYNSGSGTAYQTDPNVAEYVRRALSALGQVAAGGAVGLLLVGFLWLLFYYGRNSRL